MPQEEADKRQTSDKTQFPPGDEQIRPQLTFEIRSAGVFRALLLVVSGVVLSGTLANYIIFNVAPSPEHRLARLMRRFDLGFEPSLPAWYSSLGLLGCALLLACIAASKRRARDEFARHWTLLSLVFVLLALDEAIMIHEMASRPLQELFNSSGIFYLAWVLPASLFVLLFGIANLKFLAHLEPRERKLFLAAGIIFLAGAIGLEMLASSILADPVHEAQGIASLGHTFVQSVEEALEMLGVALFLFGLLEYISRHIGCIQMRFH